MLNLSSFCRYIGLHSSSPEGSGRGPSAQDRVENQNIKNQEAGPRNQLDDVIFGTSIGLTKFVQNQVFGDENARNFVGSNQQSKINLAVYLGQVESVTIKGKVGNLQGYFYKANPDEKNGKIALLLSGSGAPSEMHMPAIAEKYQQNGVDVLAVNYRGFGKSEGIPSEQGLYQDAGAMFKYLTQTLKIPAADVILHGYSIGGPIAAHLASKAQSDGHNVVGLILDRPMPSTSKATRAHYPKIGGIAGHIAKQSAGTLSVEKNVSPELKGTKILLITDKERLGKQGERLRDRLLSNGFNVAGTSVNALHVESDVVMESQFGAIKDALLPVLAKPPTPPALPRVHRDLPAIREQDEFMKEFGYLKDHIQVG